LEECTASIFRVKENGKQAAILKMEAVCSSEMSVNFYQIARRNIPGERTLQRK
jgi:hypothetical protein